MAYEAAVIGTDLQGGAHRFSAVRTVGGIMYAVHYVNNPASGPKRCKAWISHGAGRPGTWSEESWSQLIGGPEIDIPGVPNYLAAGDGGRDPVLLCDPADRIWLVMAGYGGIDSPHAIMRNEIEEVWGRSLLDFSGFHRFTTRTGVSSFDAVMDAAWTGSGVWSIACVYVAAGRAYYADFLASSDTEPDAAHSNYAQARIVVAQDGTKHIFLRDTAGDLWWVKTTGAGSSVSFEARVQVDGAGQVVASLEDVCIRWDGAPTCIYRVTVGAVNRLHLAEYNKFTSTWLNARVWDGSNDYGFFPGQALQYDARGSVFVVGPYDHDGDADPNDGHVTEWDHLRALDPGVTDWTRYDMTPSGVGGTIEHTQTLKSRTPYLNSYLPNYLDQGFLVFSYVWAAGAAADDQVLYMINRDEQSAPYSVYPTILATRDGDPPYRLDDANVRSTITLDGEGAAGTDFPTIQPSFEYVEEEVFETSEATFEAKYSARIATTTAGRRFISVVFTHLNSDTDKDAIKNFVLARQRDGTTFNWSTPDTEEVIPVKASPAPLEVERVQDTDDEGIWILGFQLVEAKP